MAKRINRSEEVDPIKGWGLKPYHITAVTDDGATDYRYRSKDICA